MGEPSEAFSVSAHSASEQDYKLHCKRLIVLAKDIGKECLAVGDKKAILLEIF